MKQAIADGRARLQFGRGPAAGGRRTSANSAAASVIQARCGARTSVQVFLHSVCPSARSLNIRALHGDGRQLHRLRPVELHLLRGPPARCP